MEERGATHAQRNHYIHRPHVAGKEYQCLIRIQLSKRRAKTDTNQADCWAYQSTGDHDGDAFMVDRSDEHVLRAPNGG